MGAGGRWAKERWGRGEVRAERGWGAEGKWGMESRWRQNGERGRGEVRRRGDGGEGRWGQGRGEDGGEGRMGKREDGGEGKGMRSMERRGPGWSRPGHRRCPFSTTRARLRAAPSPPGSHCPFAAGLRQLLLLVPAILWDSFPGVCTSTSRSGAGGVEGGLGSFPRGCFGQGPPHPGTPWGRGS